MFEGSPLFLLSKIILVFSVGKDVFVLNSSIFNKPDKAILLDIATFLWINSFLLFIYFFFFRGFNLLYHLFTVDGLGQIGNIGGIVSTASSYWLVGRLYARYGIVNKGTKLESISRLLFYPMISFLIYLVIYLLSNISLSILKAFY